jgi:hypothetical protein
MNLSRACVNIDNHINDTNVYGILKDPIMLVVMVILHGVEIAVMGYGITSLWGYYVPAVKKEVLEKTGIELPLPDSPLRSLLNMVLAPFAEMWTQYWALPWTLWGALVHLAVLLFLGSVFKTQVKDFQWLVGVSCLRGLTLLNWVGQFCLKCMNRVFTAAPAAPAAPAPAVKKARAKSPAPAVKKAPAKSPAREQSVIEVGTEVLCRHVAHGNIKYAATVVSIIGDWYIIKWEDKDTTDNLKHVDELTLKLD